MKNENAIVEFFKKIHLSIFNRDYLVDEVLYGTVKQSLLFFIILFALSLGVSSILRTITITQKAPDILFSAIGELKFENNTLISPDTTKHIDAWRVREFSALMTGVRIPTDAASPFAFSVGGDFFDTNDNFVHFGKSAFSSNVMAQIFGGETQVTEWSKILTNPNLKMDKAASYRTILTQPLSLMSLFFLQNVMLGGGTLFGILQIWLALFFYMLFFGKRLNAAARFRLLLLTATPYFIIATISIFAADGVWFATDLALVAALIMTVRCLNKVDIIHGDRKENG